MDFIEGGTYITYNEQYLIIPAFFFRKKRVY